MAILFQVGSVSFQVYPFSLSSYERTGSADFAVKERVSGLKPREAMGEGDEQINFKGVLNPYHFGGLSTLDVLDAMRVGQDAQPVMRGDGRFMGFYVITEVAESHEYLEVEGIGQVISVAISIIKVPDPSFDGMSALLLSLF